ASSPCEDLCLRLKLRQAESACDCDWILFVGITEKSQRRGLSWKFVSRQDAELLEAAQWIARRPIVGIVAVYCAIGRNSKQTRDELACIDSRASRPQFSSIRFEGAPKFRDLSRRTIDDILDALRQFGEASAK